MSTEPKEDHIPVEITLHSKSHVLSVTFADGVQFRLPCEYLRVYSPAAEVRAMAGPVTGKEDVNIVRVEPLGHYAVRLYFDDGHDTGVYSWGTLYELGSHQASNWGAYLQRLREIGYERTDVPEQRSPPRTIKVLYFSFLVNALGRDAEELELPVSVRDVQGLLAWLRRRGDEFGRFLGQADVRVTVNRQFSEPFTRLEDGDEVGIVPATPQPVDV